jgi:hypothetical protein
VTPPLSSASSLLAPSSCTKGGAWGTATAVFSEGCEKRRRGAERSGEEGIDEGGRKTLGYALHLPWASTLASFCLARGPSRDLPLHPIFWGQEGFHGAGSISLSLYLCLNVDVLLFFFPVASRCLANSLLLVREMGSGRIKGEGDGRGHTE